VARSSNAHRISGSIAAGSSASSETGQHISAPSVNRTALGFHSVKALTVRPTTNGTIGNDNNHAFGFARDLNLNGRQKHPTLAGQLEDQKPTLCV